MPGIISLSSLLLILVQGALSVTIQQIKNYESMHFNMGFIEWPDWQKVEKKENKPIKEELIPFCDYVMLDYDGNDPGYICYASVQHNATVKYIHVKHNLIAHVIVLSCFPPLKRAVSFIKGPNKSVFVVDFVDGKGNEVTIKNWVELNYQPWIHMTYMENKKRINACMLILSRFFSFDQDPNVIRTKMSIRLVKEPTNDINERHATLTCTIKDNVNISFIRSRYSKTPQNYGVSLLKWEEGNHSFGIIADTKIIKFSE